MNAVFPLSTLDNLVCGKHSWNLCRVLFIHIISSISQYNTSYPWVLRTSSDYLSWPRPHHIAWVLTQILPPTPFVLFLLGDHMFKVAGFPCLLAFFLCTLLALVHPYYSCMSCFPSFSLPVSCYSFASSQVS